MTSNLTTGQSRLSLDIYIIDTFHMQRMINILNRWIDCIYMGVDKNWWDYINFRRTL